MTHPNRFVVAELAARGVTLTVALVEQRNQLRYEITGPRYLAQLSQCGCDHPGRAHTEGFHEEHVIKLARTVLRTYQDRKHKPAALTGGIQIDKSRPVPYAHFVQLDGEESVDLYSLKRRSTGPGESETVAARLVCNSRRCAVDRKPWRRIAVLLPGTEYDPGRAGYLGGPVADDAPRIEGRDPFEVRNEHIQYHRENFPIHPRVELDRWIHDHAMTAAPEPDRAELDRQLAIAKAEREEMVSKKIGTRVKLKHSVGSYATTGVIREVYGEGESALYEVDTVDQTGYRKTERLMRSQFTFAGAR